MTYMKQSEIPLRNPRRLFIDGAWVEPSTSSTIDVIDSATEQTFLQVAEARAEDMSRAIAAARSAFDYGPWPALQHAERAEYVRAFARGWMARIEDVRQLWPRQSGALYSLADSFSRRAATEFASYADMADEYSFERRVPTTRGGEYGLLVAEPVGVVGAIIPWNSPLPMITHKVAPALLAGCTVVLKCSPEAPGEGLIAAEIAEEIGLPPGVLNVVTAEREVSEMLVRDRRVDKISFTGSSAVGRRIGALCGERIARCSLELGGKSAALVLDDGDLDKVVASLVTSACANSGQVCSSLTRVVVSGRRQKEVVDALVAAFSSIRIGDPFDTDMDLGPLATARQRDRVEEFIGKGIAAGATVATGGARPEHLDRGFFVEPTVFANVDSGDTIAQEEIFGPVVSVISSTDEADAIRIANDTVYGLNASIFTDDPDRFRSIASRLRSGTVGHNAVRGDFGIAFGGYKQSGIGREGGREAFRLYTELKTVIADDV
ncbi:aldehyde dehydrogenase [Rhodococcus sp. WS1]|uniref:aldehyde dehydrogenase n=1 Tax=unclassified Rhodococcus (in: high G+C Gram-positive bacteria) TaxID=192944 RepID=UPI00114204F3|nr:MULTISPECIES: aldehyde dehydrogenase [unclassified Rhodococcus (in: high G+C Gram-positive bacteria)]ROZ52895.1 aldehyde dehydrogenase [Rhodococcus sp. WS1]TQC35986.1 aldehyde dehydrogenase [Rhodococcus sp. WS7]